MHIIGIDPGPTTCGVVMYDTVTRTVEYAAPDVPVLDAVGLPRSMPLYVVACERVQSYGIAGASLLETAEVYGRIQQSALLYADRFVGIYRRDVLATLDVTGKGNCDSLVRQALLQMHGGSSASKKGGPLYGVTSHAWQALAVAVAASRLRA